MKHASTQDLARPSASRQLRLHFIELVAWWEGSVRRQAVCDAFGVTPNHVTTDLTYYRRLRPNNLIYDVSARAWRPSPTFKPAFMVGSPEEFLALLRAHLEGFAWIPGKGYTPTVKAAALPYPQDSVKKEVLRQVVHGIQQPTVLVILFHESGIAKPCDLQVWPLALIHAESRWFLRAYDVHSATFRHLPLAQILNATHLSAPPRGSLPTDADWDAMVELPIRPNPRLPALEQQFIARTHGMDRSGHGWVWQVNLRKCLVQAFVKAYNLESDDPTAPLVLDAPTGAEISRDFV